jgi:hypothetical protein
MTENTHQSTFSILPSYILELDHLEPNAKLLFAIITSLTQREGYCWASNKFLAEKMRCTDKAIEKWLKSLKDAQCIKVETVKVGMKWDRKIWISLDFQNIFANPTNVGDRTLQTEGIEPYKRRVYSISNKKIREIHRPEPPESPPPQPKVSAPPSAEASGLYDFFLGTIRERQPDFKEPNKLKWIQEFERLLKIDKRSVEKVRELIIWASTHKWWKSACLSPSKLRSEYDSMFPQMESDLEGKKEKDLLRQNVEFAKKAQETHRDGFKGLKIFNRHVINEQNGKDLSLNMIPDKFKFMLFQVFGGNYEKSPLNRGPHESSISIPSREDVRSSPGLCGEYGAV